MLVIKSEVEDFARDHVRLVVIFRLKQVAFIILELVVFLAEVQLSQLTQDILIVVVELTNLHWIFFYLGDLRLVPKVVFAINHELR